MKKLILILILSLYSISSQCQDVKTDSIFYDAKIHISNLESSVHNLNTQNQIINLNLKTFQKRNKISNGLLISGLFFTASAFLITQGDNYNLTTKSFFGIGSSFLLVHCILNIDNKKWLTTKNR